MQRASRDHLLRPGTNGTLSLSLSFLARKLVQRDNLALSVGVRLKGEAMWEMPGTQPMRRIRPEYPFLPFELKCHPHVTLPEWQSIHAFLLFSDLE